MKRLLCLALLLPTSAFAQYLNFKMLSTEAQPFSFYIDTRQANPGGIDGTQVFNAAERAINTWNSVTCSSVKLRSRGSTAGIVLNPQDGFDSFSVAPVWISSASDPDYGQVLGSDFIIAIAVPRAYAGVLETCDVFVNGVDHAFSTVATPSANAFDVESLMLHELGHCLGLDHFGPMTSVMFTSVTAGFAQRTLTATDAQMLCERYRAVGELGSACADDGGCATSSLKCVQQPVTNGISLKLCSRGCTFNAGETCEVPLSCVASTEFQPQTGACLLPGNIVTQVGKPCNDNNQCGSSVGLCQQQALTPSGGPFWTDGYCTASCGQGIPPCPAGSVCSTTATGDRCLQTCRVGLADCRVGYACVQVDDIATTGVCFPRCYTNSDCADPVNNECRTCDGACIPKRPTGQIGDFCTTTATCGTGQVCRATAAVSTQKQCTVQCSRGCGTCPGGSTCTPGARGELFCLRDCTGPGTCPNGLRCADTAVGKGCQPWCQTTTDCPVGQECFMGECYSPTTDAGCGALCTKPDAGRPVVVTPKDAGNGNGGTGGCGCASVDPLFGFAALALLGLRRKRKA